MRASIKPIIFVILLILTDFDTNVAPPMAESRVSDRFYDQKHENIRLFLNILLLSVRENEKMCYFSDFLCFSSKPGIEQFW